MTVLYLLFLFAVSTRTNNSAPLAIPVNVQKNCIDFNPYSSVADIPLPPGFTRLDAATGSYAAWLRQLRLKKDKTVYKFNGSPKTNQSAQFAVIDISTGNKDLQQCADAVMRLRAEYLYQQKRYPEIDFMDNNRTHYRLPASASRDSFNKYLEKVFSYCGTASLEKQLNAVDDFTTVKAGDVLIKGGFPGHAMQVLDIAVNKQGKKIYLLAQGYMPAQDMHVVVNPVKKHLSPWYEATDRPFIETPEWLFRPKDLKKWPEE